MNPILYLALFLFAGVAGWVILSIYSFKFAGYLWENYRIPFKPMFAFGALFIALTYPMVRGTPTLFQFLFYAVLLTVMEYFLFLIAGKMGIRFPCYYNGKRIAPIYSIYWGLLALTLIALLEKRYRFMLCLLTVLALTALILTDGRQGLIVLGDSQEMC